MVIRFNLISPANWLASRDYNCYDDTHAKWNLISTTLETYRLGEARGYVVNYISVIVVIHM